MISKIGQPSRLEGLRKSVLDMTDEEKHDMIRRVRNDRKQSKAPIVRERKVAKESKKAIDAVAKMSDEEREALLAMLRGEA